VYEEHPVEAADLATRFTMATLFSHGATQLLAGEEDRILTDPYYVRNHEAAPSTARMLRAWYDFVVEHDELLLGEDLVDVTGAYAGEYNGDCEVAFGDATVSGSPEAGAVWRRIVQAGDRLVVHVVNLLGQSDTLWDAPRRPLAATGPGVLTLRRIGREAPRVRVADPDGSPRLRDVEVRLEGDAAIALLPPVAVWQLVVVDLPGAEERA
jgi:dextranase